MKVVFLTANPFTDEGWTDPRIYKPAQSLLQAGHEVVVLGTGKYGQNPARYEVKDGIQVLRRPTLLHELYRLIRPPSKSAEQVSLNRNVYYAREVKPEKFIGKLKRHVLQFAHDLNTLLFCLAVLPEAVRQRADVYIGRGLEGLAPAYFAARLTGGRLVYDSLELWTERVRQAPYGPLHKRVVQWMEKMMCRRCDLVIVVTASIARILAEWYDIPVPMVIPNAYHSHVGAVPSPEIRQILTGEGERKVAIYTGFLDYGKGLESLVDAAEYLAPDILIVVVGDGVLRTALEAKIKAKRLEGKVRLIGWVKSSDLPTYIASADIGITPMERDTLNYYYNIDYKPFHYIACGLPLAVSDHPEKRRLVETYGIGAVFDERDPRDIARVINELLSDPVRYQAMRERAAKVGREELNWDVIAPRYVAAIEGLMKT